MGQALRRLFDNFFSVKEMRVKHLTTISLLPLNLARFGGA
jgi:hypothetical protein